MVLVQSAPSFSTTPKRTIVSTGGDYFSRPEKLGHLHSKLPRDSGRTFDEHRFAKLQIHSILQRQSDVSAEAGSAAASIGSTPLGSILSAVQPMGDTLGC